MKVTRSWLQKYFDAPLPDVTTLSDAFTSHVFEVEEVQGEMLDLKVLPDRASYALSVRGIAKELSAILDVPLVNDSLTETVVAWPSTDKLVIKTDEKYVLRHTGALYTGVKVGASPEWLKSALESVGQRSINNIVDATNFVMLNIGQPSHAFDAEKITWDGDTLKIDIREARDGEKMTILSGEEYTLKKGMYVIADGTSGQALDICGLKGGLSSGITEETKNLFISCGNYDGTLIRKMAQTLKLFTDASTRYQNKPSPELTGYGMRDILALIKEVAGGEFVGVVDIYNQKPETKIVEVTAQEISSHIGRTYSNEEVASTLKRLGMQFEKKGETFHVTSPFERTDIVIPEDLAEEVGRIVGYDSVESRSFTADETVEQSRFKGIERMKDFLIEKGYTEISTQSFAKKGEVELANPLDSDNPFLRTSLVENMLSAMKQGNHNLPLVLPPKESLKLFEIGTVFGKNSENFVLVVSEKVEDLDAEIVVSPTVTDGVYEYDLSKVNLEAYGKGYVPKRYTLGSFLPYSLYPFVLRDIAVWTSEGTTEDNVQKLIVGNAGALLFKCELFDTFSKDGKTSYGFRLVFQSMDKTLTDEEINVYMVKVTDALNSKEGWKVR